MNRISIYLDDIRIPTEHPDGGVWTIVRNYEDFVEIVSSTGLEMIDHISFDHDLDRSATEHFMLETLITYSIDYSKIKEKTGLDAAKWLILHSIETGKDLPKCWVHSANPIGAGHIIGHINLYLKKCKLPENCIRAKWNHTRPQSTSL